MARHGLPRHLLFRESCEGDGMPPLTLSYAISTFFVGGSVELRLSTAVSTLSASAANAFASGLAVEREPL